jgi:hypothetical protein
MTRMKYLVAAATLSLALEKLYMAQRVQLTATVSENQLGQRLDQALAELFPDIERNILRFKTHVFLDLNIDRDGFAAKNFFFRLVLYMAQRVQLTATVSENQLGQRLDQALAELFPDYSLFIDDIERNILRFKTHVFLDLNIDRDGFAAKNFFFNSPQRCPRTNSVNA